MLLKAENGQRGCTTSRPESGLALWPSSLRGQEGSTSRRCWVGAPETTHSSPWPWLSAPPGPPRRWRRCTRSLPTAPGWCPGFPDIRPHSQSPQLQEKGWGNRKKNNKGTNLADQVWSGYVCRASRLCSVQILRVDSSSPACLPSTSYITSLSSVPQWTGYSVCAPTWTKHRVWRITGPQ